MRLLGKLRPLKTDMEEKGWVIESFRFKFKGTNYIVLVILYEQGEPRPQYALVQLDFLHPKDFRHHLLVPANTLRLLADAKDIRIFFRIQYTISWKSRKVNKARKNAAAEVVLLNTVAQKAETIIRFCFNILYKSCLVYKLKVSWSILYTNYFDFIVFSEEINILLIAPQSFCAFL